MKYLIVIVFLILSVTLIAQIPQAPDGGSGSADDPYHIASFENLLWITQTSGYWGLHYIQTADIDASDSQQLESGAGWKPIGNASPWFTGSYDGGGYNILGLYFSRGTAFYTGLFGIVLNAKLNRINLRDVDMFGSVYCGSLAGVAQNSVVNNCSVTGSVHGSTDVGGLVGLVNYNTIITNSYSHATVQGNDNVGGFVGQNGFDNGYIYRSYSTGQVIAGTASYKGGFIGRHSGGSVNYCYWNTQSSGMATDAVASPRTTLEMKTRVNYYLWNFITQWSIQEGISYPSLELTAGWTLPPLLNLSNLNGSGIQSDPYLIDSAAKLNVIRQSMDSWYRLTSDIDLSETVVWNHGQGWQPIGGSATPFTGVLEGNGKRLINLVINRPLTDYTGLFSYTQNAMISHLELANAWLLTQNYSGGIAGSAFGGSIDNVSLSGIYLAKDYSGGLVGSLDSGLLLDSRAQLLFRTPSNVSSSNSVGGLVGVLTSTGAISGTIAGSYSNGSISAAWHLGGIVGTLRWGYVNNCFSHMSIYGGRHLGGVVGIAGGSNPCFINHCYGTGQIELIAGGSFSGGVVGYLSDGSTMEHSFWDVQTTGIPNNSTNGGKTTAQMIYPGSLETYGAWDFDTIWHHDTQGNKNNGYPYLIWQDIPVPAAVQDLSISTFGNQFQLNWQPVESVNEYNVYASEDPYAPWDQWEYLGESNTTSFIVDGGSKRFFMVRATGD